MQQRKHCGCNISLQKSYNHSNPLYDSILTINQPLQLHMATNNMQGSSISTYDSIFYVTLEDSQITIEYLPSDQMLADILMKGLPGPKVKSLIDKLGIY